MTTDRTGSKNAEHLEAIKRFISLQMTPSNLGDNLVVGDHELTAVEGQLTDIVWECGICGERATEASIFRDFECEEP